MGMEVNAPKISLTPTVIRIIAHFIGGKPILVTGAHRSGTSWVGEALSFLPNVVYFFEPFMDKRVGSLHFPYITDGNVKEYFNIFIRVIRAYTPIFLRRALYYRFFAGKEIIPLIKDPNAIFSAEWLERMFNMRIVITIRHPAGFVSSLKRLGWRTNFQEFLQQKRLMEDYLWPFEDEMRKPGKDLVEEGAIMWKCFYYVVDKYREKHPDWIFLRHEDLCKNPLKEFENLYKRLRLPFSQDIRREILEYSSMQNPIEPPNNEVNYLIRDSQSLIKQWKMRLTKEEINRIRDITGELSSKFYTDDEW